MLKPPIIMKTAVNNSTEAMTARGMIVKNPITMGWKAKAARMAAMA